MKWLNHLGCGHFIVSVTPIEVGTLLACKTCRQAMAAQQDPIKTVCAKPIDDGRTAGEITLPVEKWKHRCAIAEHRMRVGMEGLGRIANMNRLPDSFRRFAKETLLEMLKPMSLQSHVPATRTLVGTAHTSIDTCIRKMTAHERTIV